MSIKQVFVSTLTDSNNTQQYDSLGDVQYVNGLRYKYVKFTGTTAVAAGDVVCYTDNTMQAVDKANSTFGGAGVAQAAQASGAVSFGWIQIKGRAVLGQAFASGAAGNVMTTTGAAAGVIKVAAAVTDQNVGVAVDVANKVLACDFPA